jgi:hypothetical protein
VPPLLHACPALTFLTASVATGESSTFGTMPTLVLLASTSADTEPDCRSDQSTTEAEPAGRAAARASARSLFLQVCVNEQECVQDCKVRHCSRVVVVVWGGRGRYCSSGRCSEASATCAVMRGCQKVQRQCQLVGRLLELQHAPCAVMDPLFPPPQTPRSSNTSSRCWQYCALLPSFIYKTLALSQIPTSITPDPSFPLQCFIQELNPSTAKQKPFCPTHSKYPPVCNQDL